MMRKDGLIDMSFGVMGGSYQPMGHVTVTVNRCIHAMDPQEAIDFPRCFPMDGKVQVEAAMPVATCRALEQKGHLVIPAEEPLGGGQAIAIDRETGTLVGGSDFRKDGIALGC